MAKYNTQFYMAEKNIKDLVFKYTNGAIDKIKGNNATTDFGGIISSTRRQHTQGRSKLFTDLYNIVAGSEETSNGIEDI